MFTPFLYDHKFDIDDLIRALCTDNIGEAVWQLNSRDGSLAVITPDQAKLDGSDNNHIHHLTPLPVSFLAELGSHAKRKNLSTEDTTRLDAFLTTCPNMLTCLGFFEEGTAGGWLRERVKEEALEWLDHRGLIPPSMRHAWKTETTATAASSAGPLSNVKVMIE